MRENSDKGVENRQPLCRHLQPPPGKRWHDCTGQWIQRASPGSSATPPATGHLTGEEGEREGGGGGEGRKGGGGEGGKRGEGRGGGISEGRGGRVKMVGGSERWKRGGREGEGRERKQGGRGQMYSLLQHSCGVHRAGCYPQSDSTSYMYVE